LKIVLILPEVTELCVHSFSTIGAAIASAIFTAKITVNLPAQIGAYAAEAGVPADQLGAVIGAVATKGPAAVVPCESSLHCLPRQRRYGAVR
jgi:hypothetical protein